MKGSHLSIEYFKVFCDLVKTKSFRQAAAKNYLTQSAISQQLAYLERTFGKKLIERQGGVFSLTPEGTVLLEGAQTILGIQQKMLDNIRRLPTEVAGVVRLEAAYSVGLHFLPPLIRGFMKKNPRIKLEVDYLRSDRIFADVMADTCDVGVVVFPCAHHSSVEAIPLVKEKMAFVCSPQHPKAKEKAVHISDLNNESFVAFDRKLSTRKLIDETLRKHNVSVNIVHEYDNVETLKRSVEAGAGVSLLPENTVAQEVKNRSLKSIPLKDGAIYRQTGIIFKRARKRVPAVQTVIDWLLQNTER